VVGSKLLWINWSIFLARPVSAFFVVALLLVFTVPVVRHLKARVAATRAGAALATREAGRGHVVGDSQRFGWGYFVSAV